MIKKMLPVWIFLFILSVGCGVKTALTPPDVLVPKAITDLKGTIKEQAFELTWSLPEANMDGSKPVDLVRFQVLRREETRGCLECPGEFLKRAELDLRSPQGYLLEKDIVTWQDRDLKDGVIYMYKVVGINHWGYPSAPSNEVTIKWTTVPPEATQPWQPTPDTPEGQKE